MAADQMLDLSEKTVHMVGIKGTGMTALAQVLQARGARVSGSDSPERFYTDAILERLGIVPRDGFSPANIPPDTTMVIYSAAYPPATHPELVAARERGLPLLSYPQALAAISADTPLVTISGVHGKTTTTAICGLMLKALAFPVTVIVGSEVPGFGNTSSLVLGDRAVVLEACEYRRHFLSFQPDVAVITNIEADHLDYFRDLQDVESAFEQLVDRVKAGGSVIYCEDDRGARGVARRARERRPDLSYVPYGKQAEGDYRVESIETAPGELRFSIRGLADALTLGVPGEHNALNATAALAVVDRLAEVLQLPIGDRDRARQALSGFRGTRRRSEVVGEAGGVLFLDDYAHHPTAIRKTLDGLRAFYPDRRLVVDFMSHTYSRTGALMSQFAEAFGPADHVVLHRIYASARETNPGGVTGRGLYEAIRRHHPSVTYREEPADAVPNLLAELRPGDLFVTMGAGDNWKLGRELLDRLRAGKETTQ